MTVHLPAFFSDGMVIGCNAHIWGRSQPGDKIEAEFLSKQYKTVADKNGNFIFSITADNYGGPYVMKIGDRIIRDVYVGRVWLCGGQSNMETPINRARLLLEEHVTDDRRIRVFQGEKGLRFDGPAWDSKGEWHTAEGAILDTLHAVPYFFARALLEDDATPIGLISIPAGGTPIEGWLPEEIIRDYPKLYESLSECKQPGFIEEAEKTGNENTQQWYGQLHAEDTGIREGWHSEQYDDSHWESKVLLDPGGNPERGAVWFRKHFILPEVTGPATLYLGRVENSVRIYINGQLVNEVAYMYPPCVCTIAKDMLRTGENCIAIRVVGDGGRPSFVPDKRYELIYNKGRADLSGRHINPYEGHTNPDGRHIKPGERHANLGGSHTNLSEEHTNLGKEHTNLSEEHTNLSEERINLSNYWKWRAGAAMPPMKGGGTWFYGRPCGVYNYMMAPFLGYSVDGLIWYQGESNTGNPSIYKTLFARFAEHMRKHFGADLPIIFTQLANYIDPYGTGENWAALREQQRQCLTITNTAMAVIIDCGEWNDLHPLDKKTVGTRLALCARRLVYNEDIISNGPVVKDAVYTNNELTIYFDHAAGLWAKNGRPMVEVVDTDGIIHRYYAAVRGETLTARIGSINGERVRFGWSDCPPVALYNAYNLPASPFEVKISTCIP